MNRSGHVVFVINSLVGGGAERALINVIAGLEPRLRGHRVSLVLLDRLDEKHAVPAFVDKYVLDTGGGMLKSLALLTLQLRALKPDVVISFLSRANCAAVFAAKCLRFPAVISERVHTTSHFRDGGSALQKALIRLFYGRADTVIAVSPGVERDLVANFGIAPHRSVVIQNPIDMVKLRRLAELPAERPQGRYVVAVGRLVPNKNFPMLLRAFARAGGTETLVILGEGPERETLQGLAAQLGLADRLQMPGYVENPYGVVAGARVLVSSSNAEGFPNAIVEAMALGVPVIATDCETGPGDILSPGEPVAKDRVTRGAYGLLVPVERDDLLAEAMEIYADEALLSAYRAKTQAAVAGFTPERVSEKYWRSIEPYLDNPRLRTRARAASGGGAVKRAGLS